MPGKHLFEYAVIRIVPRVEREEFLNAGVVLYSAPKKFLQVKYLLDDMRITAFAPQLDIDEIKEYLCAFERICMAAPGSGTIGKLPVAERFRWLTATRSTVVQCSKVHPGLCDDPSEMLEGLYNKMVVL
jgi:hypothetical protein